MGGNLATNAGGTQVLLWQRSRLCLGLEVVTADGDVWDGLSGPAQDNTGYDLRDLFIGGEARWASSPRPRWCWCHSRRPSPPRWHRWLACATAWRCSIWPGARLGAGHRLRDDEPLSLDLVARHFPLPTPLAGAAWCVLLEQSDNDGEGAGA